MNLQYFKYDWDIIVLKIIAKIFSVRVYQFQSTSNAQVNVFICFSKKYKSLDLYMLST